MTGLRITLLPLLTDKVKASLSLGYLSMPLLVVPFPDGAGPQSQVGDAALNDDRSFYEHDSALQSSSDASEGGPGSPGGGGSSTESEAGTGAAGRRQSCAGSLLDVDVDGRSDDD